MQATAAAAVVTVTAVGRLVGKDAGFAGLESDGDALSVGGNGQRADALVEGADGLGFGAGAGRGGRGRGSGKDVQDAIFPTEEGHLLLLRLIGGSGRGERAEGVRPLAGSREVVLRGGQRGYRRHGQLAGIWRHDMCSKNEPEDLNCRRALAGHQKLGRLPPCDKCSCGGTANTRPICATERRRGRGTSPSKKFHLPPMPAPVHVVKLYFMFY